MYARQGDYAKAEEASTRLLELRLKSLGPANAQTQQTMLHHAAICKSNGKDAEAAELEKRVQDLRAPKP